MTKTPKASAAKLPVSEMEKTWLVQRLNPPFGKGGMDNPYAFGGGLVNGGIKPEGMALLRDIFSFDYMGAAEFEFGAVPTALGTLAEKASDDELVAFSFEIDVRKDVRPPWRKSTDPNPQAGTMATIYVICDRSHASEVESRIRQDAKAELRLKESTLLSAVLRSEPDWQPQCRGWLELDNGFFFFVDREMWEKTASLFGVRTEGD